MTTRVEGVMYITLFCIYFEKALYKYWLLLTLYGKFVGGIPKMLSFMRFFSKIFMVSDKTIHRAFRTHTTL